MNTGHNIDELKWIVTRVNGKIASVHLDYSGLGGVVKAVTALPCDEVASVCTEKIGTRELVELNKGLTIDDMVF
mgnify:CR=1 FL=1